MTVLHDAINEIAFGALVTISETGLQANHLPFELDRRAGIFGVLKCHVARNSVAWRGVDGRECLVIFPGPSAYISPNYYVSKREHGAVVPTYNYVAVHAHGNVVVHDDVRWLRALVGRLTKKFEANQPEPWAMGDAPAEYIEERLKEIVGLEIEITRLEGKWKMSQNRPEADREGVVTNLKGRSELGAERVAEIVKERSSKLRQ